MLEILFDVLQVLLAVGVFALAGWALLRSEEGREY